MSMLAKYIVGRTTLPCLNMGVGNIAADLMMVDRGDFSPALGQSEWSESCA